LEIFLWIWFAVRSPSLILIAPDSRDANAIKVDIEVDPKALIGGK